MLESKKKKVRKGLKPDFELKAKMLLAEMQAIYEKDKLSFFKGEPALGKAKLLRKALAELSCKKVGEYFLAEGGVEVVSNWLEPLPDGTYHRAKYVEDMLDLLKKLKLEYSQVEDTSLGKIMSCLAQDKFELKSYDVKRVANIMLDKWKREVMELNFERELYYSLE